MVRHLLSAISRILLSAAVIAPDTNDLRCCRRSELPLYAKEATPVGDLGAESAVAHKQRQSRANCIEQNVRAARIRIDSVFKEIHCLEAAAKQFVLDGVDNAQWLVDYLGDEENQAPKAPAIVIGGLTGMVFGLRGGFFKKMMYTSIGVLGMASICYPREAKEYGGIAYEEGRKYATIAYNFIYGVKKDEPALALPSLPKLPGSVSELVALITAGVATTTSPSASVTDGGASKEVRSSAQDACRWVERQKESGAYDRIVQAERLRLAQERGETPPGLEYYEGDASCPCYQGSCMRPHANDADACPAELPLASSPCPPPPLVPPAPECCELPRPDDDEPPPPPPPPPPRQPRQSPLSLHDDDLESCAVVDAPDDEEEEAPAPDDFSGRRCTGGGSCGCGDRKARCDAD